MHKLKSIQFLLVAVTACCFNIACFCQPVLNTVKENIGSMINDANDQVLPVFSFEKKTLYFSQNTGIDGNYEVWQSQLEPNGQYTPKQRANFVTGPSLLNQYIFNTLPNNLFLINGKFENKQTPKNFEKGFSWYVSSGNQFQIISTKTLQIDGLEDMLKGNIANAFYHPAKKILLLSFATSGKRDIYISTPKQQQQMPYLLWNKPIALPNTINSEWEETCPFLDETGTVLYFSSNKPGGFGGDDVYYSKLLSTDFTQWSPAKNLGFFVNSNKSELYYSVSSKDSTAYFVSYKNAYGAGDIFRIRFYVDDKWNNIPPAIKPSNSPIVTNQPSPIINNQNTTVNNTPSTTTQQGETTTNNTPIITRQQLPLEKFKPNNLILLLDVSSSMANNNKMNFLKNAANQLLSKLRFVDKVSLVTFGQSANVVFQTGSLRDKDSLIGILNKLKAVETETFINLGLQKAYTQAIANYIENGNNEVLVITDGYFSIHPKSLELIAKNPQIKLSFALIDAGSITNNIINYLQRSLPNSLVIEMVNENLDIYKMLEHIKDQSKY